MFRLHIVLFQPEIPQNTGNIARTCAATGTALHLVRPLGFEISDARLKRAGLDYWHMLHISYYEDNEDFFARNPQGNFYFLSTKGERLFSDISFRDPCYLIFGKETGGLPEALLARHYDRAFRIPMVPSARSLNLSNAVAVTVYEALRQNEYPGLLRKGHLPRSNCPGAIDCGNP